MQSCLDQFLKLGYARGQLKGVGLANQRETTIAWDRNTGKPLYNARKLALLASHSVCCRSC